MWLDVYEDVNELTKEEQLEPNFSKLFEKLVLVVEWLVFIVEVHQ